MAPNPSIFAKDYIVALGCLNAFVFFMGKPVSSLVEYMFARRHMAELKAIEAQKKAHKK